MQHYTEKEFKLTIIIMMIYCVPINLLNRNSHDDEGWQGRDVPGGSCITLVPNISTYKHPK